MIRSEKEERFASSDNQRKMEFIDNGNYTRSNFNSLSRQGMNQTQAEPWTNPVHMERLEKYLE